MAEPASRYLPSGNYHIFAPRPLRPDVELKCPVFVEPDTPPGQNRPLYVAQVHGIQPTEFHFEWIRLPETPFPIYRITLARDNPSNLLPGPVNEVGDRVEVVDPSTRPTEWIVTPSGSSDRTYTIQPYIIGPPEARYWNPSKVTNLPLPPPPLPVVLYFEERFEWEIVQVK